jgi:hypothetical protein
MLAEQGGAVKFEASACGHFARAFDQTRAAIHQNHGHFIVGAPPLAGRTFNRCGRRSAAFRRTMKQDSAQA